MKKILMCLVFATVSTTAMADILESAEIASGITFAPTVSVTGVYQCLKGQADDLTCTFLLPTYGLISTSTLLVLLKEEVQQVEQDAYNMLAGEGMSDALKELIEKVKSEHVELANHSDADVATLLIDSLKIK